MSAPGGPAAAVDRRYPVGAEVLPDGGVHFRIWAPGRRTVEVRWETEGRDGVTPLSAEEAGYWSGPIPEAGAGTRYRFRLDGEEAFPDPASRFQPEGPHGPSEVIDPAFRWTDEGWPGLSMPGQALYEVHIGTWTPEGSWRAAAERLPSLAELGVTAVAVLPVAEFHGRFGWGYDGVALFAPTRLYGRPDDFRAFVDRAHAEGLGVLLDVVWNHAGAVGNYLEAFSERYFSRTYQTAWGEAFNFDEAESEPVRELFRTNVTYWIEEFHLDGFRVDAANHIHDASTEHILTELIKCGRRAAGEREILWIAENESQDAGLVRAPSEGGRGFDATWSEDFHHAAMVAVSGRREGYYLDFRGTAQELVSVLRHGFLYQGQRSRWQNKRRGTPALDLPPGAFVAYLQNHDQVANTPRGERIHRLVGPAPLRAITGLFLLAPMTPLLFQGQESGASAPFLYFADPPAELAEATRSGRTEHLAQFRSLAASDIGRWMAEPTDPSTFERCRLDPNAEGDAALRALHRDLLHLRRDDPTLRAGLRRAPEGAVLARRALALRYPGAEGNDRLLIANLGTERILDVAPEPILAPPPHAEWRILWSSEDPAYGGWGTPPLETGEGWRLPAWTTVLLAADATG